MANRKLRYEALSGISGAGRIKWRQLNFLYRSYSLYMVPIIYKFQLGLNLSAQSGYSDWTDPISWLPIPESAHTLGLRLNHNYLKHIWRLDVLSSSKTCDLSRTILSTFWPQILTVITLNLIQQCILYPFQVLTFIYLLALTNPILNQDSSSSPTILDNLNETYRQATSANLYSNSTSYLENSTMTSIINMPTMTPPIGGSISINNEIAPINGMYVMLTGSTLIITNWLLNLANYPIQSEALTLGSECRSGLSQLIHRKLLKVNQLALNQQLESQLRDLITKQVHSFDNVFLDLANLISIPIQLLFVSTIVLYELQYEGSSILLTCLGIAIVVLAIQTILGKSLLLVSSQLNQISRNRQTLMSKILVNYRSIRMRCLESDFVNNIISERDRELNKLDSNWNSITWILLLQSMSPKISLFVVTIIYTTLFNDGYALKLNILFVSFLLVEYIPKSINISLPGSCSSLANALRACQLIEQFLNLPENYQSQLKYSTIDQSTRSMQNPELEPLGWAIKITRFRAYSSELFENPDLDTSQVNLRVDKGQLILITGPSKSGKSSLMMAIAGELPVARGYIKLNGSISLVSQRPWLFQGTIQENITMFKRLELIRYTEVLRVSGLDREFKRLQLSDEFYLNGTGTGNTSGIDQHPIRYLICLARSLYENADIYLLDEPLGLSNPYPIDVLVNSIEWLRNYRKTILLGTRKLKGLIELADKVVVLPSKEGDSESQEVDQALKAEEVKKLLNEQLDDLTGCSKFLGNDQPGENGIRLPPSSTRGSLFIWKCIRFYVIASGVNLIAFLVVTANAQFSSTVIDWFLSNWFNSHAPNIIRKFPIYIPLLIINWILIYSKLLSFHQNNMGFSARLFCRIFNVLVHSDQANIDKHVDVRTINRDLAIIDNRIQISGYQFVSGSLLALGTLSLVIYYEPLLISIASLIMFSTVSSLKSLTQVTISSLSKLESDSRPGIWAQLESTIRGVPLIRSFKVQDNLTDKLNEQLDRHSSCLLGRTSAKLFTQLMVDFIILSVTSMALGAVTWFPDWPPISIGFIALLSVWLPGQIRVVTNSLDELDEDFVAINNTQTWLKSCGGRKAIGFESDDDDDDDEEEDEDLNPGELTQVDETIQEDPTADESLARPARAQTNGLAQASTSIYAPGGQIVGPIEFIDVTFNWQARGIAPLYGINLKIGLNQKVGLFSLNDSSSSSLISTLLSLYPLDSGQILIGSTDIRYMLSSKLRERISFISEQSLLINGTLARNLIYPGDEESGLITRGDELNGVLKQAHLSSFVESLTRGLDEQIRDNGLSWPVAIKQLICLARAMLAKNKIIIMEEAKSELITFDEWCQIDDCLRNCFHDCSVITLVKGKRTLERLDRLIVLENGNIVDDITGDELRQESSNGNRLAKLVGAA